jgi:hypothetical protein
MVTRVFEARGEVFSGEVDKMLKRKRVFKEHRINEWNPNIRELALSDMQNFRELLQRTSRAEPSKNEISILSVDMKELNKIAARIEQGLLFSKSAATD